MTIVALQAAKLEGNSGLTEFDFTVFGGGDSDSYALAGSETPSGLFAGGMAPAGTVAKGQTATVAVFVNADTVAAPDQAFTLQETELTLPPAIGFHATIAYYTATSTVLNDDPVTVADGATAASFSIAATDAVKTPGYGTTPFAFTVSRTGDLSPAVTLGYAATGIDARPLPGGSFANPTGSVTLAAGSASATIVLDAVRPSNPGAEAFAVALSVPGSRITTSAAGQALAPASLGLHDVVLGGSHDQYAIAATSDGQAAVRDMVAGRDGSQVIAGLRHITFSDGEGVFDPTGAGESITRLYQAAFNRAPDAAGLDLFTNGVASGGLTISALAATFVGSPEFVRAYGGNLDDGAFVAQLYQNVLHRAPDAAGAQDFVNFLGVGNSRGDALVGIADSPENRRNLLAEAGDRNDAEAARLYHAALGRAPDAAGLTLFSNALQNGLAPVQLAQTFVGSTEFGLRYGMLDNTGFATQLYQNVLGRAPDQAGLAVQVGALDNGASRASVLLGISDSTENRIGTAGLTHDAWVFLGNVPTPA